MANSVILILGISISWKWLKSEEKASCRKTSNTSSSSTSSLLLLITIIILSFFFQERQLPLAAPHVDVSGVLEARRPYVFLQMDLES